MALLSDPVTAPRVGGGWRWLDPRRPEGMSVWGSAGVLLVSALLWVERGALSEVWPNRCGLLREQLAPLEASGFELTDEARVSEGWAEGRWALPISLPVGTATLWLPAVSYEGPPEVREEGGGVRVLLRGEGVEVEGLLKRVSAEAARAALSGVAGRAWAHEPNTLYLARLGLSLSVRALTCDRELAEVEVEHMAALLLRGGLSAQERPRLRAAYLVGTEAWWLSLEGVERAGEGVERAGGEERAWFPLGEASEGGRWAWEWRVRFKAGAAPAPSQARERAPIPQRWWAERVNEAARALGALGVAPKD